MLSMTDGHLDPRIFDSDHSACVDQGEFAK